MKRQSNGARRQPTMKQVAEAAGVHVSTVSRALNPATRSMVVASLANRVLKAAKTLGYRVDPVAASLRNLLQWKRSMIRSFITRSRR